MGSRRSDFPTAAERLLLGIAANEATIALQRWQAETEERIRQTAQDTVDAVRRMVTAGAQVIVCLGGDGTARVTASAAGDVPMLALSTGTNNTFPAVREATIAGLAAGLVATGTVPADGVTARAKLLEARVGDRAETALIDVAVSTERHVGSRAVWDPATLTQLFCAFAEPDAIGLSSILGQLSPVARHEPSELGVRSHAIDALIRDSRNRVVPDLFQTWLIR